MKTPNNLNEAIEYLVELFNKDEKNKKLLELNEDSFLGELHHFIGMTIRNDWGLWYDDTNISKYFKNLGIIHGDDRSGIILTSLYRTLKNQPINIEEQVKYYFDYWKECDIKYYNKMLKKIKNNGNSI